MNTSRSRSIINWTPRLGFTLLLLTFSELITWYDAHHYSLFDWLAIIVIYLALAAISLDLIARWYSQEWLNVLIVGGIYGIVQSGLVTLGLYQDLPISFLLHATGAQTVMFVLAYGAFRFLYTGKLPELWFYGIAPLVGLAGGIWTRWLPELDSINQPVPELGETLPYTVIALIACALVVFYLILPDEVEREDWLLLPMEWAIAGGLLVVTLILRLDSGAISTWGLVMAGAVASMLGLMLWFIKSVFPTAEFKLALEPDGRLLTRWIVMFIPFSVAVWIGYQLPGNDGSSIQSNILFILLAIFGAVWLPLVSIRVSFRAFIELSKEEY